jgi:hypothetical protein
MKFSLQHYIGEFTALFATVTVKNHADICHIVQGGLLEISRHFVM